MIMGAWREELGWRRLERRLAKDEAEVQREIAERDKQRKEAKSDKEEK